MSYIQTTIYFASEGEHGQHNKQKNLLSYVPYTN